MNVQVAVQMLSESVAKSLEFCCKNKFEGCDAAIKFMKIFNCVFEILN